MAASHSVAALNFSLGRVCSLVGSRLFWVWFQFELLHPETVTLHPRPVSESPYQVHQHPRDSPYDLLVREDPKVCHCSSGDFGQW